LKLFTTIHKHYTVEQWIEFANANKEILPVRYERLKIHFDYLAFFVVVECSSINWYDRK